MLPFSPSYPLGKDYDCRESYVQPKWEALRILLIEASIPPRFIEEISASLLSQFLGALLRRLSGLWVLSPLAAPPYADVGRALVHENKPPRRIYSANKTPSPRAPRASVRLARRHPASFLSIHPSFSRIARLIVATTPSPRASLPTARGSALGWPRRCSRVALPQGALLLLSTREDAPSAPRCEGFGARSSLSLLRRFM